MRRCKLSVKGKSKDKGEKSTASWPQKAQTEIQRDTGVRSDNQDKERARL
ncbi:hypothetical protein ES702_07265 [subsurface metagenome]